LPLLEECLSTPVPNLAVEISIFTTLSASSSVTSLNEKDAEPASTAPSSLSSGDAEKLGMDDAKPEAAGLPIKWYSGRADLEAVLRSTVKEASVIASAAAVAVNGECIESSPVPLISSSRSLWTLDPGSLHAPRGGCGKRAKHGAARPEGGSAV
jgi:hypothetical protein